MLLAASVCPVCNDKDCGLFSHLKTVSYATLELREEALRRFHPDVAAKPVPETQEQLKSRLAEERKERNDSRPKQIEVCPVCCKYNCRLYLRLIKVKADDRSKLFADNHRVVCLTCRRLYCGGPKDKRCKPPKMTCYGGRTQKVLPPWWSDQALPVKEQHTS